MLFRRVSKLTGVEHERDIPITPEQHENYQAGMLIQNAAPNLSKDDREFLISGTTPEEWSALENEDDDDPDKRYHR